MKELQRSYTVGPKSYGRFVEQLLIESYNAVSSVTGKIYIEKPPYCVRALLLSAINLILEKTPAYCAANPSVLFITFLDTATWSSHITMTRNSYN